MPSFGPAADTANALALLREEIDLKIPFASTEASNLWKAIKPELNRIEQSFRILVSLQSTASGSPAADAVDEAALQIHLGLMDAKTHWETLEPRVYPILTQLGCDPGFMAASHQRAPRPVTSVPPSSPQEARVSA